MRHRRRTRRVCMLAYTYYATDARVRREAEALGEQGYDIDVICLRCPGEPASEMVNGVCLYHVPMTRYRGNGAMLYLRGYSTFFALAAVALLIHFVRRRYSVIQVHTLPDFMVFAALAYKPFGTRLVLDMHDTMPELYASRFGGAERSMAFRLLVLAERWSTKAADVLLVVHPRQKEILAGRGIPESKMHVVMNCADDRLFDPRLYEGFGEHTADSGETSRPFVVLYHGTILKRYGLDTLVQAAALVAVDLPWIRVDIVGDGDFAADLAQQIRALGVASSVRLLGAVPYDQIPVQILGAGACVIPNKRDLFTDDILPVKLLEAVAMHRPVISARTRNILRHFDDAALCFFTPGDAEDLARSLRRIATDPRLRAHLVDEASRQARPYHWSHAKAAYLAIMAILAGTPAHRPGHASEMRNSA